MPALKTNHSAGGVEAGELKPGVRPYESGWYWARREGFAMPECVHFRAPVAGVQDDRATISSVCGGERHFAGTSYDSDSTRWYGPLSQPACWLFK